jgi:hypothetical protein
MLMNVNLIHNLGHDNMVPDVLSKMERL